MIEESYQRGSARSLYFTRPGAVEVRPESMPIPGPGQALIETECSAISAGTEMLVYRGQFPVELSVDEGIEALAGEFSYPLKFGYASVGKVIDVNGDVDPFWIGKRAFAFQPHASHFACDTAGLIQVPDDIPAQAAAFLPNMETAVNFVMDGAPLLGEQALVFGQGVVGLLTTALLAMFPLVRLVALDQFPLRRRASLAAGADEVYDPQDPNILDSLSRAMPDGADLIFELSGSPAALDMAIHSAGYTGRVIVGSWYGQKRANLDLGGSFHRKRIQLVSSQVTTIAPPLSGRWDKKRRFEASWEMLRKIEPARWITHQFSLDEADQAYRLLDQNPAEAIQVIFQYDV